MSDPENGDNIARQRVGVLTVIAWVTGIGGIAALGFWGWLLSEIGAVADRVGKLERGETTPMAQTTRLRLEAIDKQIDRLEYRVGRLEDAQ